MKLSFSLFTVYGLVATAMTQVDAISIKYEDEASFDVATATMNLRMELEEFQTWPTTLAEYGYVEMGSQASPTLVMHSDMSYTLEDGAGDGTTLPFVLITAEYPTRHSSLAQYYPVGMQGDVIKMQHDTDDLFHVQPRRGLYAWGLQIYTTEPSLANEIVLELDSGERLIFPYPAPFSHAFIGFTSETSIASFKVFGRDSSSTTKVSEAIGLYTNHLKYSFFPNTDQCPTNPDKIWPGVCGCDIPDTDSDGDGTSDCIDECPTNAGMVLEGVCGCDDVDSDGDGTLDCVDGCPLDRYKVLPGVCGCNERDIDSDGDGYMDCEDECPSDYYKFEEGTCGCNNIDYAVCGSVCGSGADSDGDGVPDCLDVCPNHFFDDCTRVTVTVDGVAQCLETIDGTDQASIVSWYPYQTGAGALTPPDVNGLGIQDMNDASVGLFAVETLAGVSLVMMFDQLGGTYDGNMVGEISCTGECGGNFPDTSFIQVRDDPFDSLIASGGVLRFSNKWIKAYIDGLATRPLATDEVCISFQSGSGVSNGLNYYELVSGSYVRKQLDAAPIGKTFCVKVGCA